MEKHFTTTYISGLTMFLIGIVFYLLFRHEESHLILANYSSDNLLMAFGHKSFPSFVHVVALSFFTIGLVSLTRINIFLSGMFWLGMNILYEWFSSTQISTLTSLDFYSDLGDVLAAFIGTAFFFTTTTLLKHIYPNLAEGETA